MFINPWNGRPPTLNTTPSSQARTFTTSARREAARLAQCRRTKPTHIYAPCSDSIPHPPCDRPDDTLAPPPEYVTVSTMTTIMVPLLLVSLVNRIGTGPFAHSDASACVTNSLRAQQFSWLQQKDHPSNRALAGRGIGIKRLHTNDLGVTGPKKRRVAIPCTLVSQAGS